MARRLQSFHDLAPLLGEAGSLYVSGCAAELVGLDAVLALVKGRDALTVSGIFVPGVNTVDYAAAGEAIRLQTYFMTPELAAARHGRVDYCPWRYRDIIRFYSGPSVDAAVVMLSPPDAEGFCSYGIASDFSPLVLPRARVRIAAINPQMPRLPGVKVALDSLDYWVEMDGPLREVTKAVVDDASDAIASHAAAFIGDGSTIQLGLGSISSAIAARLTDRRNLQIRSGLIDSTVLELDRVGALRPDFPILSNVALGDGDLYRALDDNPRLWFQPVTVTHEIETMAATDSFIAINGALQVDLLGQVNSTVLPKGFLSGPGGLPEFVAGSLRSRGGRSIIALNATRHGGGVSRIVPQLDGAAPSVAFSDADTVVTEFGVAELRGKSLEARIRAMIAIADPCHRERLAEAARQRFFL